MKAFMKTTLGAALLGMSLHTSAAIVDVIGTAEGSGFLERATVNPAPFDPLFASFELSYDEMDIPATGNGTVDVALNTLALSIGTTVYGASDATARLEFAGGALIALSVGGNANGGLDSLLGNTDDFLFSNVGGVELFQYTSAGNPGTQNGLFEVFVVPGQANVGQASVTFSETFAVPTPATSLLLAGGLLVLATRARSTLRDAARTARGTMPGALTA